MSLLEAMRTALANSKVLSRDRRPVLQSPANVRTTMDRRSPKPIRALALKPRKAQFDPVVIRQIVFREVPLRGQQHLLLRRYAYLPAGYGGVPDRYHQRTATGSMYSLSTNTDYDANNAPGNLFPHAWNNTCKPRSGSPGCKGGAEFTRIYGPPNVPGVFSGVPGFANGVMVARINTDISLTDLEAGLATW